MELKNALLIFVLLFCRHAAAQLPCENCTVNYRIVGFRDGSLPYGKYNLEIAGGECTDEAAFLKNKILSYQFEGDRTIAEVPAFGAKYSWRISSAAGRQRQKPAIHHFSTGRTAAVDTGTVKVLVTCAAKKYEDAYVFLDNNGALYDMKGRPVWYLPDSNGITGLPADMKETPQRTITFFSPSNDAFEVDYNGHILWKGPNNGTVSGRSDEHYHHQCSRLRNGHYMALGFENMAAKKKYPQEPWGEYYTDSLYKFNIDDTGYTSFQFATIIEYDSSGNIVWSWKFSDYFKRSDLWYFRRRNKPIDFNMHFNGFYFDEEHKYIYFSLKMCSRIVKISYPDGNVVAEYGMKYAPGKYDQRNGNFYGQHAVNISDGGYMYLYNNNFSDTCCFPEVLRLREVPGFRDSLEKFWSFSCPEDYAIPQKNLYIALQVGGNVVELPDQSIFVAMSGVYGEVFIVDKQKNILWSAVSERKSGDHWEPMPQYRASLILNRSELELLIWNAQNSPLHK